MKAKEHQVSALIPQIKSGFKAALVFGPEQGMVQEVSEKIAGIIVENMKDDFCVVKLTPSKIKEIPSILTDEGNAVSLLGGRKLIWLKEADNTILEAVVDYVEQIKTDSFLLISAGNLTKSSGLRNWGENHEAVLSVVCYAEADKEVQAFIRGYLFEKQKTISRPALVLMSEKLGENRLLTRQELDKLITYLGDKKTVDEADVDAVITDTAGASADALCCAVATGQLTQAQREYTLMIENGETEVAIIRILYNYFNKLLDAACVVEQNGIEAGVAKMLRPAQYRMTDSVRLQLRLLKKPFIVKVLKNLIQTEKEAKTTGFPIGIALNRVVLQITNAVRRIK